MHVELKQGISQVNLEVNFNLCMEKLALNNRQHQNWLLAITYQNIYMYYLDCKIVDMRSKSLYLAQFTCWTDREVNKNQ